MENPAENMIRAWRDLASRLEGLPAGGAEDDLTRAFFRPMQEQAALFENAIQMFRDEQRAMREHLLAPVAEMVEQFEDVAGSLRASGEALVRAGELMDRQAIAMDRAVVVAHELKRTMAWPPDPGTFGGEDRADDRDESAR